jgi:ribosome maturation factor RimP
MDMQADLDRITQLAESVASSLGLSLVDVRLAQQGRRRTLEVTIYRVGGRVSLEDCEQVSRQMDAAIEAEDTPFLEGAFDLEVQSPGIDRKLATEREYKLFSGQLVEVKTKQKVEGLGSAFTGKLLGLEQGSISIANPQKISDSPKVKGASKKAHAKPGEDSPSSIVVDMSNVISVRLQPQLQKLDADADADADIDLDSLESLTTE